MRKKARIADPASSISTTTTSWLLPFRQAPRPPPTSAASAASPFLLRRKPWRPRRILDPRSDVVLQWNRIFLVSCLVALFLDPLYFYLQSIGGPACVDIDLNLGIIVTFFRTVADLFYLAHMILKFRTAFVAPSSRVFGRGELVRDPDQIAIRYLKSDFVIDLIIVWFIIPAVNGSKAHTNHTLALIVLIQYIPRLFLIFPLNARIVKATGVVAKTAWAGAAYNLLLYMLASHVLGALWYLLSMERQTDCWVRECKRSEMNSTAPLCRPIFLDCSTLELPDRKAWLNKTQVLSKCEPSNNPGSFNMGMFAEAFTNEVTSSSFFEKYLYCLWWGLRNLRYTFQGESSYSYCLIGSILAYLLQCGFLLLAIFSYEKSLL
ncbi:hypothetical protein Taro_056817, partial [Colocasia esculenta]|nr:hypothetical protein [Colocasia esculenta]